MQFQTVEELMATPGLDLDPTKRSDPEQWPDGEHHQTTVRPDAWPNPDIETEEDDHDAGDLPDDEFDRDDDEPIWHDDMHRLFDENYGLTAEGYALLAKMDDMGDFV